MASSTSSQDRGAAGLDERKALCKTGARAFLGANPGATPAKGLEGLGPAAGAATTASTGALSPSLRPVPTGAGQALLWVTGNLEKGPGEDLVGRGQSGWAWPPRSRHPRMCDTCVPETRDRTSGQGAQHPPGPSPADTAVGQGLGVPVPKFLPHCKGLPLRRQPRGLGRRLRLEEGNRSWGTKAALATQGTVL